jgi:hypothetical protein
MRSLMIACRLASFGSSSLPASRQLLLELLPSAAATASTPHRQLLVQLLQGVVGVMCEKQSLGVDVVLQVLQCIPLTKSEVHDQMLEIAYRDGEPVRISEKIHSDRSICVVRWQWISTSLLESC